jgi:hypothetical protein
MSYQELLVNDIPVSTLESVAISAVLRACDIIRVGFLFIPHYSKKNQDLTMLSHNLIKRLNMRSSTLSTKKLSQSLPF